VIELYFFVDIKIILGDYSIPKLIRFSNLIITSFGNYTCLKIINQSMQINL